MAITRAEFEERFFGTLKWLSVAFFVIIAVFPLIYMVSLSFKPIQDLLLDPGKFWPSLDQISGFETYRAVLRPTSEGGRGFLVFIRNSAIVASVTVILTISVGILSAYAVARLNFFGKRSMSFSILLVYLFPAVIIAIPDLDREALGKEYRSNVTIIAEGNSRFFSTPDLENCLTDITSLDALDDAGNSFSLGGLLYCVSPLPEVNGDSSVSMPELRFHGLLDWGSS